MTTATYTPNIQPSLSMRFFAIEEKNSQPKEFTPLTTNAIVFPYKIRIQFTNYSDKEKTLGFIFCNHVKGLNLSVESLDKQSSPIDKDMETTLQMTTILARKTMNLFLARVTNPITNDQSTSFKIVEKSSNSKGVVLFSANFNAAETLKKQQINFRESRPLLSQQIPRCVFSQKPPHLLPVKAALYDGAENIIPLEQSPKKGYFFRGGIHLLLENQSNTARQVTFLFKQLTCGLHLGFTVNNMIIPAQIKNDCTNNFTFSCQKIQVNPETQIKCHLVRRSEDLINVPASQLEILLVNQSAKVVELIGKVLFQLNPDDEKNELKKNLTWLEKAPELQHLNAYSEPSISAHSEYLPFELNDSQYFSYS
ncbi:MAG: hypothetical protein VX777_06885 [Chlamydiota bacterium]|nr:hypothetical protein [Chlamydiota bacterium]